MHGVKPAKANRPKLPHQRGFFTGLKRRGRLQYLRLLRSKGAPQQIARGFAIGTWVEFIVFPTLGAAFVLLWPLNWLLRGNLAASFIAFVLWKMVLWAFIWPNIQIGHWLLGTHQVVEKVPKAELKGWAAKLAFVKTQGLAFFVGSTVTGLVAAAIGYFLVLTVLKAYHDRRERRRHAMLVKRHDASLRGR
jgi:uncharacterized protein (DUF2062 family)